MDRDRYNRLAILFHWVMAVLIFYTAAAILITDDLPRGAFREFIKTTDNSVGALVILLLALWILWRMISTAPALPSAMIAQQQRLAKLAHLGLNALTAAVPLLGLATHFLRRRGLEFGFFSIASPLVANRTLSRSIKEVHELAAYAPLALVAFHIAAALWHQFIKRDGLMTRMGFSRPLPADQRL
ncbi:MAG: cytochrome b [Alphaproteobacteria bacterium]|nr:cytochrome b [Alphaproteobacteria bacterium]